MGMKLPRSDQIPVTPEVLKLVSEIDEFKGKWVATQALAPERLVALRKVATVESVGSSTRIEGVKLSNSEIEALLRGIKAFSFRSRDEQEVAGYAEVMEMIFSSFKEIPISENHIKQLHGALLKYSEKDEHHRGEYKKFQNNVEAFDSDGKSKGVIFEPASPYDTPRLMKELLDWVNEQMDLQQIHPLLILSLFVVVFLQIHPFQDGNGRLSRALTTLILLRSGYQYVPYSSLERVIEENKEGYYLALRQGQGDLEKNTLGQGIKNWILFFLRSMQKQKASLERKVNEELSAVELPELSIQIIELIRGRGPTSMAEVVSITRANRNTIKVHFKRLVEDAYLVLEGAGRGSRYRLR